MKLVIIEWMDSHGALEGWQHIDINETPSPIKCKSVGWLVYDGDDCKKIIPHIAGDDDNLQGRGDLVIPAQAIVNTKEVL
jgi:hypothetical protein